MVFLLDGSPPSGAFWMQLGFHAVLSREPALFGTNEIPFRNHWFGLVWGRSPHSMPIDPRTLPPKKKRTYFVFVFFPGRLFDCQFGFALKRFPKAPRRSEPRAALDLERSPRLGRFEARCGSRWPSRRRRPRSRDGAPASGWCSSGRLGRPKQSAQTNKCRAGRGRTKQM